MDFGDTPEEATFRTEVRAWLEANATRKSADSFVKQPTAQSIETTTEERDKQERAGIARARAWQNTLYDAGWAGVHWPKEYGGRSATPIQSAIFAEEQSVFNESAAAFTISIGMVGPTLIAHGSDEQKDNHLPSILRGDENWCQLFSEPGAGSDLAGLRTRAERVDEGWLVNGQKVWTSGARTADFGALIARTDASNPKHKGISYFIVDMTSPGIEIHPLPQMNGAAHFNEVYLTDVLLPADAVVGEVNDGWRVANTMLLNERGLMGDRTMSDTDLILDLAQFRGHAADPVTRQQIAKVYGREQILRFLGYESRTALSKGTPAPAIASISKLLIGQHERDLTRFALDLLGSEGMVHGADGYLGGEWQSRFLSAPMMRIAGGADEIQKNILGERHLGLPPDHRPDKGIAFKDIPKS